MMMSKPVIIECGHIFQEDNIQNWFKIHDTCPKCRQQITNKNTAQCNELLNEINTLKGKLDRKFPDFDVPQRPRTNTIIPINTNVNYPAVPSAPPPSYPSRNQIEEIIELNRRMNILEEGNNIRTIGAQNLPPESRNKCCNPCAPLKKRWSNYTTEGKIFYIWYIISFIIIYLVSGYYFHAMEYDWKTETCVIANHITKFKNNKTCIEKYGYTYCLESRCRPTKKEKKICIDDEINQIEIYLNTTYPIGSEIPCWVNRATNHMESDMGNLNNYKDMRYLLILCFVLGPILAVGPTLLLAGIFILTKDILY